MTVETDMFAQARSSQCVRTGPEAKALDAWLRKALAERFDTTLAEGVPVELAALAARFDN
jgi:hypothetical protein